DELEQSNIKKEDYETQNHQLFEKIEKLDSIIKVMQDVVDESKVYEEQATTDSGLEELQGDLYENLEHVLHRVELSIKFMNQDPDRTKMELAVVSENLRKILQQNIEE
ncbi:MAG: hypothetical protein K2N81_02140, partial [Acetatifactor sp.]|nr:hypothetical protein [Acetatifactor sp.]